MQGEEYVVSLTYNGSPVVDGIYEVLIRECPGGAADGQAIIDGNAASYEVGRVLMLLLLPMPKEIRWSFLQRIAQDCELIEAQRDQPSN